MGRGVGGWRVLVGGTASCSLAIRNKKQSPAFSKAIQKFVREDPTFRTHVDENTNETIISGMGELHLEVR